MAKPYIPNAFPQAAYPDSIYDPVLRLDYAPDHAPITEPITIPSPDGEGRCRVELDYAIRSSYEPTITIDGVELTNSFYGESVGPSEAGVSTTDVPIVEFHTSLAGLTGDIVYAPLCSVRSSSFENQLAAEMRAVELAVENGHSGYSGFSGYSGATGSSGYSGYSGFSGYSGAAGNAGISGLSGFSGQSGYSGANGASGFSGYSGRSGYSGYSGANGSTGTSGFSGYSGFSGRSGYSGVIGASGFSGRSGYSGFSGRSGYSGFSGFSGAQGPAGPIVPLGSLSDVSIEPTSLATDNFLRYDNGVGEWYNVPLTITDVGGLTTALNAKANLSGATFSGEVVVPSIKTDELYINGTSQTGAILYSDSSGFEFNSAGGSLDIICFGSGFFANGLEAGKTYINHTTTSTNEAILDLYSGAIINSPDKSCASMLQIRTSSRNLSLGINNYSEGSISSNALVSIGQNYYRTLQVGQNATTANGTLAVTSTGTFGDAVTISKNSASYWTGLTVENTNAGFRGEIAVKGAAGGGFTFHAATGLKWFVGAGTDLQFYDYQGTPGNVMALSGGTNKGSALYATGTGSHDFRANGNTKLKINSTGIGFYGVTPVARPTIYDYLYSQYYYSGGGISSSEVYDLLYTLMTALHNQGIINRVYY